MQFFLRAAAAGRMLMGGCLEAGSRHFQLAVVISISSLFTRASNVIIS
jgi:hypothetical protein